LLFHFTHPCSLIPPLPSLHSCTYLYSLTPPSPSRPAGGSVSPEDLRFLLDKRFKAHVTALARAGKHAEAAVAAAGHLAFAAPMLGDGAAAALAAPLIRLHVQSRLKALAQEGFSSSAAATSEPKQQQQQQQPALPQKSSAAAKAAKGRGKPAPAAAAPPAPPAPAPAFGLHTSIPPLLTEHLCRVASSSSAAATPLKTPADGGNPSCSLLGLLDLYAYEEAALLQEVPMPEGWREQQGRGWAQLIGEQTASVAGESNGESRGVGRGGK
jgi:hypothetical protein